MLAAEHCWLRVSGLFLLGAPAVQTADKCVEHAKDARERCARLDGCVAVATHRAAPSASFCEQHHFALLRAPLAIGEDKENKQHTDTWLRLTRTNAADNATCPQLLEELHWSNSSWAWEHWVESSGPAEEESPPRASRARGTLHRQCNYCPARCGVDAFNDERLDQMFARLSASIGGLYSLYSSSRTDGDLVRFRVSNRTISSCGAPEWRTVWPLRYWGVAFTIQKFLSTARLCDVDNFDFEMFVMLGDGPFTKPRPAANMPTFSMCTLLSEYRDIPLPWHDQLNGMLERVSALDATPAEMRTWARKQSVVKSAHGGNTWDSRYVRTFQKLYGSSWAFSHRVAMCLFANRSWVRFGITAKQLHGKTRTVKLANLLCSPKRLNQEQHQYSDLARYRYHLNLDGASSSFYDAALYAAGLVLQPETPFSTWLSPEFKPMQHYWPVKRDLSDLDATFSKIEADPELAQKIFEQGNSRLRKLISWPSVECYLCGVFRRYQQKFDEMRQRSNPQLETCDKFKLCKYDGEPAPTDHERDPPLFVSSCAKPHDLGT
ncbi:hypothetical protein AB1Y20_004480 [Prymnesium parvum]|uniref:Glycosyl transferase CAP10 domain-containing protein n=1 Tax=Prymnesium parvum TaxID=97485 RepID=A0AB34J0D8_PRYPA